jgi:hypothetical protein
LIRQSIPSLSVPSTPVLALTYAGSVSLPVTIAKVLKPTCRVASSAAPDAGVNLTEIL